MRQREVVAAVRPQIRTERVLVVDVGTSSVRAAVFDRNGTSLHERAQELLLSGQANVTDAAFAVGYQSLAQFIRSFRQITGQLPSDVARRGKK